MASNQDRHIFVTGCVGCAMGSGKFTAQDILTLTQAAFDTFDAVFGKPDEAPAAPRAAPGHIAHTVQAVASSFGAFTKPFSMWGGDKAYLGQKDWEFDGRPSHDITWGEWTGAASQGNEKAIKQLKYTANSAPGDDPKWKAKNIERIAKAKACLKIIADGYKEAEMPPTEEAPF